MIKRLTEENSMKFKNLSPEEKEKRGILGRLYGPVASFAAPTRNGRKYTQELWEKLFNSDLIKERFSNGGIFGQLCHPDYEEVDMEKIACVMPEAPVKDKNGDLISYVDILDTPCGKIAYQLAKYGYNFGISSRGTGDLIDGPDGEEVDPDSYNLTAFDLVEIPAVANARLSFTESLDKKRYNKTLRQCLTEELNKASDEDRKLMEESLENMKIELNEARVLTKSGPTARQEEHKIVDTFIDEKGERRFKLDNGAWVTEKDVDAIEASDARIAELDAERKAKEIADVKDATVTEAAVGEEPNEDEAFVKGNWEKILKGIKSMGGSVDSLTKVYNEMMGDQEPEAEVELEEASPRVRDRSRDCIVKEALDLDMEDDFMLYSDLTHAIYGALEDVLNNDPNGAAKKVSENDIMKAVEEAVWRYGDMYDLAESCKNESISENCGDKLEEEKDAGDAGDLKELQEALVKANELEKDNLSLQEKLSVSNAKAKDLEEELKKYKASTAKLSDVAKKVKPLKEQLENANKELNALEENLETSGKKLENAKVARSESQKELTEAKKQNEELSNQIETLNEDLKKYKFACQSYKKKLAESKEAYVKAKADAIGVEPSKILNKLDESYKLTDVDSVCEDLSKYRNTISKLPFIINENTQIKVKPSTNEYIRGRRPEETDDYISDSLLTIINN